MAIILLLAAGCAHHLEGRVLGEPPPVEGGEAAEVIVMRERSNYASGHLFTVSLDEMELFALAPGEYVGFRASPGRHTVRVSSLPVMPFGKGLELDCEPGGRYFVRIAPDWKSIVFLIGSQFRVELLEDGEPDMDGYRPLRAGESKERPD